MQVNVIFNPDGTCRLYAIDGRGRIFNQEFKTVTSLTMYCNEQGIVPLVCDCQNLD